MEFEFLANFYCSFSSGDMDTRGIKMQEINNISLLRLTLQNIFLKINLIILALKLTNDLYIPKQILNLKADLL